MILFLLMGAAPPVLVISLLAMCYLTGYELSKDDELQFLYKAWWVLFVLLFNVVGFGVFWGWLIHRRRKARPAQQG